MRGYRRSQGVAAKAGVELLIFGRRAVGGVQVLVVAYVFALAGGWGTERPLVQHKCTC